MRKIPLKCSCSTLVFGVMAGFSSSSAEFKPRRGILVIRKNENVNLSSCLIVGHSCGQRRKQLSQPLPRPFRSRLGGMCSGEAACRVICASRELAPADKQVVGMEGDLLQNPAPVNAVAKFSLIHGTKMLHSAQGVCRLKTIRRGSAIPFNSPRWDKWVLKICRLHLRL